MRVSFVYETTLGQEVVDGEKIPWSLEDEKKWLFADFVGSLRPKSLKLSEVVTD